MWRPRARTSGAIFLLEAQRPSGQTRWHARQSQSAHPGVTKTALRRHDTPSQRQAATAPIPARIGAIIAANDCRGGSDAPRITQSAGYTSISRRWNQDNRMDQSVCQENQHVP
jgi:hypothetical protein